MRIAAILFLFLVFNLLTACSPKVWSKEWCEEMKKKPKGDWSVNPVPRAYARGFGALPPWSIILD